MYREVNELSELNKLFTTLISEKINIMNYLANGIYETKINLSDTLNDLSYTLDDSLDVVKDLIKIKKGYPIYKLSDIELTSSIKTHVSQDYREGSIIDNIKKEINVILNIIKEIIQKLNMNTGYETISALSNISYNLKKLLLEI
jgi:DNA-binding ferritin-like protein